MAEAILDQTQAQENQRNLRRLVLSMRASLSKLNLLIAICDNPHYRDELMQTYETELQAQGIRCHRVKLDRTTPSLKEALLSLPPVTEPAPPQVVTVLGADELLGVRLSAAKSAQKKFFFSVQWTREGLRAFQYPIVLWVTEQVAAGLAQAAPDFWSWRGGVFEFVRPLVYDGVFGSAGAGDKTAPPIASTTDITKPPQPIADPTELTAQIQALLTSEPDSPLLASLYFSLGEAYQNRLAQGKAKDYPQEMQLAIAAFQQAIQRQAPSATVDLARSLNNLATLYRSMGRYESALPLYEQALEICQTELGDRHPDTATSLNNLAALYESMGRYESALPLLEQALEIRQSSLGDRHPDTASSLSNLAALYRLMGRYEAALPLSEQVLEIYQTELGDRHPTTASSLNNLAALYESMGRYESALPLYEQALEIRQSSLGDRHPDTATSLNNLALLYYSMGRYESALPLYEQALEIRQTELGDRHPDTAGTLFNLAGLYHKTQQHQQALSFIQQALQIYIPTLGDDHPTTQNAKGWLQAIQQALAP